jgi:hypothetical protein
MFTVPAETPATTPALLTVARDIRLEAHVPIGELMSVVVPATQTSELPVIGAGFALTVAIRVTKQPVGIVYEIVVVPAEKPVRKPVEGVMSATAGVWLLQTPPAKPEVYVCEPPTQIGVTTLEIPGVVFTVTDLNVRHPVGNV